MPDFRENILTGDTVIIAEDRARRPGAFAAPLANLDEGECPFCEGRECQTPHETFAIRRAGTAADTPGWQVRMFPNRYPAIAPPVGNALRGVPESIHDAFSNVRNAAEGVPYRLTTPATGVHEVIVESPRHLHSLVALSPEEIVGVVRSYRDRMRALAERGDIECLVLFKNSGAGAGASLAHIHSQLIGLPQTPPQIAERARRSRVYHEQHGRALCDDWLSEELAVGERIVSETGGLVALCPWASRFPAETWLVPKTCPAHFEQLGDEQVANVAALLHDTLRRLEIATGDAPYNFFLSNPPASEPADTPTRWHLAILPRVANPGGFEWSTGIHINPISPERAAKCLRNGAPLV